MKLSGGLGTTTTKIKQKERVPSPSLHYCTSDTTTHNSSTCRQYADAPQQRQDHRASAKDTRSITLVYSSCNYQSRTRFTLADPGSTHFALQVQIPIPLQFEPVHSRLSRKVPRVRSLFGQGSATHPILDPLGTNNGGRLKHLRSVRHQNIDRDANALNLRFW